MTLELKKIEKLNKPYKIYAEVLESGAIDQFVNVMEHDAIIQGALMPDAHQGYSLPIGGVVKSEGLIFPAFVGYDIGCGMCAAKLPISKELVIEHADEIFQHIYQDIPTGFRMNNDFMESSTKLSVDDLSGRGISVVHNWETRKKKDFRVGIGSLGGGNHFIEIGYDEDDQVWAVIHSGSRGIGHGIAGHYMKLAGGGKAKEGNYGLRVDSEDGQDYINDMNWGLQYALDNRKEMMARVSYCVGRVLHGDAFIAYALNAGRNLTHGLINRNHNHATEQDGKWIHRKGATHAEKGMQGVIPGNMRDGSFIVTGLGNDDSMQSSSHGAGRVLGRKAAKEKLSLEEFESQMQGSTCVAAKVEASTLDEAPMAYKNIFEVMDLQSDLVKVEHHIKPLVNIKA
tara:strand:- start:83171 stop:84364 length:1194 start_codon:yes stop_codon:yes gene_type:complete